MKVIKGEKNEITIEGEGEIIIGTKPHKPSFEIYGFDNFTLKEIVRYDTPLFIRNPHWRWWQIWRRKYIQVNYEYIRSPDDYAIGNPLDNITFTEVRKIKP